MNYIAKRVVVDAYEFTGSSSSAGEIIHRLNDARLLEAHWATFDGQPRLTLTFDAVGKIMVKEGEWLVRYPDASLVVMTAADFIAQFEEAPRDG